MKCVRDVMTTDIASLTPEDNLFEAAVLMKERNVGVIPVCEDKKLLGVITDRDLVIRGLAEKHPGSYKVANVISKGVSTIAANTGLIEAAEMMSQQQIRRLPVIEEGRLVGMLSLGDLALDTQSNHMAEEALSEISEPPHHTH